MYKRWTEDEIDFINKYHKTKTLTEISEELNVDRKKLYEKCLKMGIRFPDMWTKEQDDYLINNYKDMTYKDIGNIIGRSKSAVQGRCRKLGLIKGYPSYKKELNSNFFERIDTEEKAYWLGFICADGCVAYDKRNKYNGFKIALQASDADHLRKFIKAIDGKFDVKFKDVKSSFGNGKIYKSCEVAFRDKKFTSDLLRYFQLNKTYNIRIPNNIPSHLMRHFLRGYSDGDGCFYCNLEKRKKEFSITAYNIDMLHDIQNVFSENEIHSNIYKHHTNYALKVFALDSLSKLNEYFYSDSTVYLERKKIKSDNILKLAS